MNKKKWEINDLIRRNAFYLKINCFGRFNILLKDPIKKKNKKSKREKRRIRLRLRAKSDLEKLEKKKVSRVK